MTTVTLSLEEAVLLTEMVAEGLDHIELRLATEAEPFHARLRMRQALLRTLSLRLDGTASGEPQLVEAEGAIAAAADRAAHRITAAIVQCSAARTVAHADPAAAVAYLDSISGEARAALRELTTAGRAATDEPPTGDTP